MMMSWGRPPWKRMAGRPAAMTILGCGGLQMLIEPLGNDDATRDRLRGACIRRLQARAKRARR
jgi:hypothetical protein